MWSDCSINPLLSSRLWHIQTNINGQLNCSWRAVIRLVQCGLRAIGRGIGRALGPTKLSSIAIAPLLSSLQAISFSKLNVTVHKTLPQALWKKLVRFRDCPSSWGEECHCIFAHPTNVFRMGGTGSYVLECRGRLSRLQHANAQCKSRHFHPSYSTKGPWLAKANTMSEPMSQQLRVMENNIGYT